MAQSDSSSSSSSTTTTLLTLTILFTLLAAAGAAIYMTDAGQDLLEWAGERFFKYKAKAEEKAFEKAGSDELQGFLKGESSAEWSEATVGRERL